MSRIVKFIAALVLVLAPLAAVTSPAQASDRTWSTFSTGMDHTCAIRASSHTLYCWGYNEDGELGNGTNTSPQTTPTRVGTSTWSAVSGGTSSTCALRESHTLYCWGSNNDGLLGTGDDMDHFSPARVGSSQWRSVDVGATHACAIRTSHTLYCWGHNSRGQLGDGSDLSQEEPKRVGTHNDWDAVSTGNEDTCAIRAGRLYCWGYNNVGQLGLGDETDRTTPKRVGTKTDWTKITLGQYTTCGIRNGHEYCWGENYDGEVGNGTHHNVYDSPRRVGHSLDSWTATGVGTYHSCGIGSGHKLYCWGYGGDGQLGRGTLTDTTTPKRESRHDTDWSKVADGDRFTCALRSTHALYCWGDNYYGQLGLGDTVRRSEPRHVV